MKVRWVCRKYCENYSFYLMGIKVNDKRRVIIYDCNWNFIICLKNFLKILCINGNNMLKYWEIYKGVKFVEKKGKFLEKV